MPSARTGVSLWGMQTPMVPTIINTSEDLPGQGQGHSSGSNMVNATMVSPVDPASVRRTSPAPQERQSGDLPNSEGIHHANRSTSASRLAIVWQQCQSGGLSTEAARLLSASWRSKTTSSYESLFKWWDSWCKERGRDPITGPMGGVANFSG